MAGHEALCPFCNVPWSARMLDLFDRASVGGCSCCGTDTHQSHAPEHDAPAEEIVCDSCGRALYTLPAVTEI